MKNDKKALVVDFESGWFMLVFDEAENMKYYNCDEHEYDVVDLVEFLIDIERIECDFENSCDIETLIGKSIFEITPDDFEYIKDVLTK